MKQGGMRRGGSRLSHSFKSKREQQHAHHQGQLHSRTTRFALLDAQFGEAPLEPGGHALLALLTIGQQALR